MGTIEMRRQRQHLIYLHHEHADIRPDLARWQRIPDRHA